MKKLDLYVIELLEDICFMIDVYDEFIDTVMNKKVLTEYVKLRKKS